MRWVLLEHDWDGVHYDLLVECAESCLTFAFDSDPFEALSGKCERKPDHRKHYLTHEGPVTKGRGTVRRIREGSYGSMEEGGGRIFLRTEPPNAFEMVFSPEGGTGWKYGVTRVPAK